MITGINHLTFAVRDLERSLAFYVQVLGLRPVACWDHGAYLQAGSLWVALTVDEQARSGPHPDYTHTALAVRAEDFSGLETRIRASGAAIWQENESEGRSLYFLDPDGHRLEIHVTGLAERLRAFEDEPPVGLKLFPA